MSESRVSTPKDPDLRMPPALDCEICGKEPAVGVAAMPGVPYSAAYGRACMAAGAHPYDMLVVNTAMIVQGYPSPEQDTDVLADTADWWVAMVNNTLTHLGKSRAEFDADVRQAARTIDEAEQDDHTISDIGD